MAKYIDLQLVSELADNNGYVRYEDILGIPAADVVSRGAYEQVAWERDVALEQLRGIGKSLGERMDDIAVKKPKKKYIAGMYGGKFMPMHIGHLACIQRASELCDKVYLILFSGGEQEKMIAENDHRQMLSLEFRREQLKRAASMFDNVVPLEIDVSSCRLQNGEEDWDAETPLVLKSCGYFDAVFGSEPGYAPYFERAYPWAKYEMVDAARTLVPISATKVRAMKNEKEIEAWIV